MVLLRSRKGQESAPFELLIAVIVMAFVMLFGYRAIEEMQRAECKALINQELEKMRTAVENTTNQGSLEMIVFSVPACFKDGKVRLDTLRNKVVCSQICKEGRDQCMSLDYWGRGYTKRVCVNIPMHTEFEGTASGGMGTYCDDRRSETTGSPISYELKPFTDEDVGVPNGTYELMNRTPPGWSKPVVCAYKKERGVS